MTFCWLLQRCLPAGLVSLWYTSERNDKRQHHSVWSWVWGRLTSVQRALESLLWSHQGLAHCFHSTRFISQQALPFHNLLNLNLGKFVTLYYTVLRQLIILPHIKKASAENWNADSPVFQSCDHYCWGLSAHLSEDLLEHNSRRSGAWMRRHWCVCMQ